MAAANGDDHFIIPKPSTPSAKGNPRQSMNGPAFPSRNTFYSGTPTQPVIQQQIEANNHDHLVEDGDDFGAQPDIGGHNDNAMAVARVTVPVVNREVQTDSEASPASAIPVADVGRFRLTGRLRESKCFLYCVKFSLLKVA